MFNLLMNLSKLHLKQRKIVNDEDINIENIDQVFKF